MHFDKPVVFLKDIPSIVASFDFGILLEAKYLGGVPNVTYRVISSANKLAIRICNHGYTSVDHLTMEVNLLNHLQQCGFTEAPVPVQGIDGEYIQNWHGYRVFAMKLIEGIPGDRVKITPGICNDVGRVISQMGKALLSYPGKIPVGETYIDRGMRLLNLLPETSNLMGWNIDTGKIIDQWESACTTLENFKNTIDYSVIHTDVWPPNILCEDGKVVGVVDFDDWAYGPVMLDLSASLVEFPWFNSMNFDDNLTFELFRGFFHHGGSLTEYERLLLPVGMEMSCASWLSCNALHRIQFEESEIYLEKLNLLRNSQARKELVKRILVCIDEAQNSDKSTM